MFFGMCWSQHAAGSQLPIQLPAGTTASERWTASVPIAPPKSWWTWSRCVGVQRLGNCYRWRVGDGDRWVEVWWSYWRGGLMSNRGVYPHAGAIISIIWEWGLTSMRKEPRIIPFCSWGGTDLWTPNRWGLNAESCGAVPEDAWRFRGLQRFIPVLIVINWPQIGELIDVDGDKTTWWRVYYLFLG